MGVGLKIQKICNTVISTGWGVDGSKYGYKKAGDT